MLVVDDLKAGYGRIPILMGVSFALAAGEYLGILGHNGMGKTTLMRTLMGYLPANGGSVAFEGRDVTRLPTYASARLGLGFVPQGREIFPSLTVMENLRMGLAGGARAGTGEIDDVLADFPRLVRLLDRRGGALSGGEQQLLALARCLVGRPKLILLDEPTEGIQPSIRDEIVETLLALKARRGIATILVEQNLEFITSLSDRILTIQKGRITAELDPTRLASPEAVAEYVGMAT